MDNSSFLDLLKPLTDALGISMGWLKATAINAMFGTAYLKNLFGWDGKKAVACAAVISVAMAAAQYWASPLIALAGSALVMIVTSVMLKAASKTGEKVGMRPLSKPDVR